MNEEQWSLREVVFVEDVKNVPVGKVCLKSTFFFFFLITLDKLIVQVV